LFETVLIISPMAKLARRNGMSIVVKGMDWKVQLFIYVLEGLGNLKS